MVPVARPWITKFSAASAFSTRVTTYASRRRPGCTWCAAGTPPGRRRGAGSAATAPARPAAGPPHPPGCRSARPRRTLGDARARRAAAPGSADPDRVPCEPSPAVTSRGRPAASQGCLPPPSFFGHAERCPRPPFLMISGTATAQTACSVLGWQTRSRDGHANRDHLPAQGEGQRPETRIHLPGHRPALTLSARQALRTPHHNAMPLHADNRTIYAADAG